MAKPAKIAIMMIIPKSPSDIILFANLVWANFSLKIGGREEGY
jgi:hypothetical protein